MEHLSHAATVRHCMELGNPITSRVSQQELEQIWDGGTVFFRVGMARHSSRR